MSATAPQDSSDTHLGITMLASCSCAPSCDCGLYVIVCVALAMLPLYYTAIGVAIAEKTVQFHSTLRKGVEVAFWPLLLPFRALGWLVSD